MRVDLTESHKEFAFDTVKIDFLRLEHVFVHK